MTHTHSLLELCKDTPDVAGASKADHDVQFLQLHVDRIVVLHKEDLNVIPQDLRTEEE